MIPHIVTPDYLVVVLQDGTPTSVPKNHPDYEEIMALVIKEGASLEDYERIESLTKPIQRIRKAIGNDKYVDITISPAGTVSAVVDGMDYSVPTDLADTLVSVSKAKGDLEPFAKFLQKLSENPRKDVADELWKFITACGLTLQEDGNFLAYKNVRGDFTSIYDRKTDNSPGTVLKMRYQDVESSRYKTCDRGYHFAAWGYLSHYSSSYNGKTVLLSISPADVVSIPNDYNNMKGRACRYKVLCEVQRPEELKGLYYADSSKFTV